MTNSDALPIERAYEFCPRCGSKAESVGAIPFRCRQCQFATYFGPVAAVVALIVDDQSQLLLVRRSRDPGKGSWGLPGGFVDRGETMEQALAREIVEETQLEMTESRPLLSGPNHYNYRGLVSPVIDQFYICEVADRDTIVLAADELDDFVWTHPGREYLDNMAFESNRIAIEFWLLTLSDS